MAKMLFYSYQGLDIQAYRGFARIGFGQRMLAMKRLGYHAVVACEERGVLRGSKPVCLRSSSCLIVKLQVHGKRTINVVTAIHICSFDLDRPILLGF
jgi:hypothetical protein